MKKKTRITIQTRQTVTVRVLRVRCEQCGAEVQVPSAANADGTIAGDALHAIAEQSAQKLICGSSTATASDSDSENSTLLGGERQ